MRISDWSSDVCSSDLHARAPLHARTAGRQLAGGCGAGCPSSTCMDGSPASGRASAQQKGGDMKDTPWQHVRVTCHSCGKVNTFALFNPSSLSPEEFMLCSYCTSIIGPWAIFAGPLEPPPHTALRLGA